MHEEHEHDTTLYSEHDTLYSENDTTLYLEQYSKMKSERFRNIKNKNKERRKPSFAKENTKLYKYTLSKIMT